MHDRLLVLTKFFAENKKGVLNFKYGADIHRSMTSYEISHVGPTVYQELNKKALKFKEAEFNFS
jgi:hypothetical protein